MNSKLPSGFRYLAGLFALPLAAAALEPEAPGPMVSTLLLANPNDDQTQVTVSFTDRAGGLASTIQQTLPPKGWVRLPVPGGGFDGSATVAASHPIQALAIGSNGSQTARDAYEGMQADTSLSFPLFRHLGSDAQKSRISIQNTSGSASVQATLHYYDENGNEQGASTQTLPPLGGHTFDSFALFGANSHTYTARVDADGPVTGAARLQFVKDSAAFAGIGGQASGTGFLLDSVERKGGAANPASWSEIYVQNRGSGTADVKVVFFKSKGRKIAEQSRAIPPKGFALFDTRPLKPSTFDGYALVQQSGNEALAVQSITVLNRGRRLLGFNGLASGSTVGSWVCADAQRSRNPARKVGLNVLNLAGTAQRFSVQLFDPVAGTPSASKSYTAKANQRITVSLVANPYRKAGKDFAGLALVRAEGAGKLVVTGSSQNPQGGFTGYACQPMS